MDSPPVDLVARLEFSAIDPSIPWSELVSQSIAEEAPDNEAAPPAELVPPMHRAEFSDSAGAAKAAAAERVRVANESVVATVRHEFEQMRAAGLIERIDAQPHRPNSVRVVALRLNNFVESVKIEHLLDGWDETPTASGGATTHTLASIRALGLVPLREQLAAVLTPFRIAFEQKGGTVGVFAQWASLAMVSAPSGFVGRGRGRGQPRGRGRGRGRGQPRGRGGARGGAAAPAAATPAATAADGTPKKRRRRGGRGRKGRGRGSAAGPVEILRRDPTPEPAVPIADSAEFPTLGTP
jgi:hypothetical protein